MRSRSIISRILWLHVVVVGGASLVIPLMLYVLLAAETDSLHRRAMREQADVILSHLSRDGDQWRLGLSTDLQALYSPAYGRYSYAVRDGAGRVVLSSLGEGKAVFSDVRPTPTPEEFKRQVNGAVLAGVGIPAVAAGENMWIEIAENMSHRDVFSDDLVSNFFSAVAWVTIPILLLVIVIDAVIVRRSFRSVLLASRQARDIGPRRTDVRLAVDAIPSEVRPLVDAVNLALERLDHGFRMQREFSADAAHELRTPLTILRTRIDTLPDQVVSQALRGDIELMSRSVGQLLEIAELEAVTVDPTARADLRAVCTDVVAFLAPLALDQDKDVALGGSERAVWIAGDAGMIAGAVRNLAENAIRHTPPGSTVDVVVDDDGTVRVSDQGPGIAEHDREHLFRRFWRKDRSRSGSTGLGLAIVRRIVDLHGGTIAVENRPQGGAEFVVTFGRPIAAAGT
jgi:signal transduction histidine kinase